MSKVIWVVIAVVVIAAAYFMFQPGTQSTETTPAPAAVTPPAPMATVSDNPDVVISDIINSANAESVTPEDSNPALVADNGQTIDAFDQSSNPTQF